MRQEAYLCRQPEGPVRFHGLDDLCLELVLRIARALALHCRIDAVEDGHEHKGHVHKLVQRDLAERRSDRPRWK